MFFRVGGVGFAVFLGNEAKTAFERGERRRKRGRKRSQFEFDAGRKESRGKGSEDVPREPSVGYLLLAEYPVSVGSVEIAGGGWRGSVEASKVRENE